MVDEAVLAKKLASIRDNALAALADRHVLEAELAQRLSAGSGLRELMHQYGAVDAGGIFDLASNDVEDLLSFCQQLARRAERG